MTEVEKRLNRLRKECDECGAPGDNPCCGCKISEEINELQKTLNKMNTFDQCIQQMISPSNLKH